MIQIPLILIFRYLPVAVGFGVSSYVIAYAYAKNRDARSRRYFWIPLIVIALGTVLAVGYHMKDAAAITAGATAGVVVGLAVGAIRARVSPRAS
jgi:hypothetical protein